MQELSYLHGRSTLQGSCASSMNFEDWSLFFSRKSLSEKQWYKAGTQSLLMRELSYLHGWRTLKGSCASHLNFEDWPLFFSKKSLLVKQWYNFVQAGTLPFLIPEMSSFYARTRTL